MSAPESAHGRGLLGGSERARLLLWTAAAALIVRLFYFAEWSRSAFFGVPLLDETFYHQMALALSNGTPIQDVNPGFRPMAYAAILSWIYGFVGDWGPALAVVMQHLFGILTAVLVADVARKLFNNALAGAASGGLYILAGPPLFFEGQLLNTTLTTFAAVLMAALLTEANLAKDGAETGKGFRDLLRWCLVGGLIGLTAQMRPNVLPVLLIFPIMALWNPWKSSWPRRVIACAGAGLSTLAVLAFMAWCQAPYFQSFQLLPTSGGVNFYLGNKENADGMIPRQDRHTSSGDRYRDSVQIFAEQVFIEETGAEPPVDPGDVSSFWYAKTLKDMAQRPVDASLHFIRKALLLLWNHEIPNNKSFQFVSTQELPMLGFLPVRWAVLLFLGVLGWGVAATRGRRPLWGWLTAFLLLYGAGLVLFFVNARFRIPIWPALAIFAGGGLWALFEALKTRSLQTLPRWALAVAAGVLLLSAVNWLDVDPETPYRDHFFRSMALQHKGLLEEARQDAEKAVELAPQDPAAQFQLGTLALELDDLDTAEVHMSRATLMLPTEPRVFNNLGIVLEKKKKYSNAFVSYLKATEIGPEFSPAWVNLALLELRAGREELAEEHVRHAEQLGDRSVALQCARAFVELKRGRIDVGKAILAGAMKRDEELTRRLVNEHARPLELGVWKPPEAETPPPDPAPAEGSENDDSSP